jgi:hypothetical protein
VTISIMVVASSICAQTDTKKEKEALDKKTLALLNEVASAAWGLKLPENRIFIMANTADLLWPFDEKRAQSLPRSAYHHQLVCSRESETR